MMVTPTINLFYSYIQSVDPKQDLRSDTLYFLKRLPVGARFELNQIMEHNLASNLAELAVRRLIKVHKLEPYKVEVSVTKQGEAFLALAPTED